MTQSEAALAIATMKERGFQAWVARKTGVSRSTITAIFTGKRRCTVAQAAKLEEIFILKGIPLNRWDLLYGYETSPGGSVSIIDYLRKKLLNDEAVRG